MKIGKITGHVNATTKDPKLVGFKTLIADILDGEGNICLLYTSPSPRDKRQSRMPSSA